MIASESLHFGGVDARIEEFVNGLDAIPGIRNVTVEGEPLSRERLMEVAKVVDSDGNKNGTINYMEFLQALSARIVCVVCRQVRDRLVHERTIDCI